MESTINRMTDIIIEHSTDEGEILTYTEEVFATFPNFSQKLQSILQGNIKDVCVAKDKNGNILMAKFMGGYRNIFTELNPNVKVYPRCEDNIKEYFSYVKYGFVDIENELASAKISLKYADETIDDSTARSEERSEARGDKRKAEEQIKWFEYLSAISKYRQHQKSYTSNNSY